MSEKVELTSTTNFVAKNSSKKKRARKRWLPFRREKRTGNKVIILDDDQSFHTHIISQSESPMTSYSLGYPDEQKCSASIRDHRYNKKELLTAESQVQKYVMELTNSIQASLRSSSSDSLSKASNDRNAKLTSSSGVLLFDGVEDFPDVSFHNVVIEENKYQNNDIQFVVAPRDYDPVASGFYKPKRRQNRTFYESDEEENINARQSKVSAGIEIVLKDGSLSVLS